ncbi:MAG TPA: hypothetical protein VF753_16830 [Terriglobales bacterium]
MPRKIKIKNLRVDGIRISLPVFKQVAEQLLPGTNPTLNQQKNGKRSKLAIARELLAVDPDFRKRFKEGARQVLAGPIKKAASEFGYKAESTAGISLTDAEIIELDQYFGGLVAWTLGKDVQCPNPPAWAADEHFRAYWAPTKERERIETEKHGRMLTTDERKAHGTFDDGLRGPDHSLPMVA